METGNWFTIPYPFVRGEYDGSYDGSAPVATWQPGIRYEWISAEDTGAVADGLGSCTFAVASVHKPGRYPTRVFFTRTFTDPDGKTFGNLKLHIATLQKFNRLIAGYRYPFGIGEPLPHHWSLAKSREWFEAELAKHVVAMGILEEL